MFFSTDLYLIVSTLTIYEKFLLLASYIASHNSPKMDVKLFGNAGKKAHRIKKIVQQSKQHERVILNR